MVYFVCLLFCLWFLSLVLLIVLGNMQFILIMSFLVILFFFVCFLLYVRKDFFNDYKLKKHDE